MITNYAIKVLKNLWQSFSQDYDTAKALEMAIEALKAKKEMQDDIH